MGLEELLKAVEEDALRERDRIIREAEEYGDDLILKAGEDAGRIRERRLSSLLEALDAGRAAALNRARIRARGILLKARRESVDEALRDAEEAFKGIPRDEYAGFINRMYKELKKGGHGGWEVIVNPADAGLLEDPEAVVEPDEGVSSGVALVSPDGRVRLENTFASRLGKGKKELLPLLDRILFGG